MQFHALKERGFSFPLQPFHFCTHFPLFKEEFREGDRLLLSLLPISLCSSQSNFSFIHVSVVKVKIQETLHLIPVLGPRTTTICVLRWAFTRIFCFALQFQNEADLVDMGCSQTLVPSLNQPLPECPKLFLRALLSASLQGLYDTGQGIHMRLGKRDFKIYASLEVDSDTGAHNNSGTFT